LVGSDEIARIIAPYIKAECDARSPEWRVAVAYVEQRPATKQKPRMRAAVRRTKQRAKRRALIKRRLWQSLAALGRPRALKRRMSQLIATLSPALAPTAPLIDASLTRGEWVKARYDKYWRRIAPEQFVLGGGSEIPCRWGERQLIMRFAGLKRTYLFHLYRLINAVAPRNVLEIGCGDGLNTALMASRFPHINFTGLELTNGGIAHCRRLVGDALPDALVDFSPEPVLSRTAHRRASIQQGDAARLPYRDGSFDLVVTVLALAQMKHIGQAALGELVRVCNGWVVMIEPFREWNLAGERRRYVDAMGYLAASVADLPQYGLTPVFTTDDLPAKINFGVGMVVARKVDGQKLSRAST
jgi:SAM-dependent methyltransferase